MKLFKTAVVFAGGKSSRMGEDKALLPFGGYTTLAEFQYRKLEKLFDKVYISSKENKFDFPCNIIEDIHKTSSPLVGLLSVFQTLESQNIFILSVDAPFVDEHTINTIMHERFKENVDAVVARSPYGVEPLCGLYKRSLYPLMQQHYKENNHKLLTLLKHARTHFVPFYNKYIFSNLNHREEYQEALKRFFNR